MHEIILFSEKQWKNNVCAYPTLYFQTCYPKHTYFLFGLICVLVAEMNHPNELSHLDDSFEYTHHMFQVRNKEINF